MCSQEHPVRSVEVTEDEITDLDRLKELLFADVQDPRSMAYPRVLERPPVPWLGMILYAVVPLGIATALAFGLCALGLSQAMSALVAALLWMAFVLVNLKRLAIRLVKLYQHFAPASIRRKCRFEPSCSQYMILAIQKYGLIRGVHKGIGRLKRCNIRGGGVDLP